MTKKQVTNLCDGCQRGLPVKPSPYGGQPLHYKPKSWGYNDETVSYCTKDRYNDKEIEKVANAPQCDCAGWDDHGYQHEPCCAVRVSERKAKPQGDTPEWEEMKGLIAQEILGKLEYRGFYDAGKYLDGDIIEAIEPFIHKLQQEAYEKGKREFVEALKNTTSEEIFNAGREAERKELVEAIEKHEKEMESKYDNFNCWDEYHDALNEVYTLITQRGKNL